MDNLEIEIKYNLENTESIRTQLKNSGSRCIGKVFEYNIRFENTDNTLIQKNCLLRLRRDKKSKLTYKMKPPVEDNDFKIHHELEVEISDFSTMKKILESVGFHQEQVYEKWRETFVTGNSVLCLDRMPFGDFLEIEGEKEDIRKLSDQLGLKWKKRLVQNYLELFDIIKQKLNLHFKDVTFDNFKNVQLGNLDDLFKSLEAGKE